MRADRRGGAPSVSYLSMVERASAALAQISRCGRHIGKIHAGYLDENTEVEGGAGTARARAWRRARWKPPSCSLTNSADALPEPCPRRNHRRHLRQLLDSRLAETRHNNPDIERAARNAAAGDALNPRGADGDLRAARPASQMFDESAGRSAAGRRVDQSRSKRPGRCWSPAFAQPGGGRLKYELAFSSPRCCTRRRGHLASTAPCIRGRRASSPPPRNGCAGRAVCVAGFRMQFLRGCSAVPRISVRRFLIREAPQRSAGRKSRDRCAGHRR